MKTASLLLLATVLVVEARFPEIEDPKPKPVRQPPVFVAPGAPPAPAKAATVVQTQSAVSERVPLVSAEKAQLVVAKFKEIHAKLGQPRLLICINRELPGAGESAMASLPLADRQTMRDIERLVGRPFRAAGVILVDHEVAAQALAGKSIKTVAGPAVGEEGAKQRQAISELAPVVVEILVSSRQVTAKELGGERTYQMPDMQATAIQVADARILGQASSADLAAKVGGPAALAGNYTTPEITEALALALMEDMAR
mgnify:CR=1 FL=1